MPALIQWLTSHSETGTNLYTGSPRSKLNHHSMRLPVEDEELCRLIFVTRAAAPAAFRVKWFSISRLFQSCFCYFVMYYTKPEIEAPNLFHHHHHYQCCS